MSGIDTPIKKFKPIPKSQLEPILQAQRKRTALAQYQHEQRVWNARPNTSGVDEERTEKEIAAFMKKLEIQVEARKRDLLDGIKCSEILQWTYETPIWCRNEPGPGQTFVDFIMDEAETKFGAKVKGNIAVVYFTIPMVDSDDAPPVEDTEMNDDK